MYQWEIYSHFKKWFRGKTATKVFSHEPREVALKYHNTVVAKVIDNDLCWVIELNTDRFRTITTKNRINDVLALMKYPRRVSQSRRQWYLGMENFYDGMRITVQKGAR